MRIYALLVLCVLLWSGNFVLGRFVASSMEAWELAFFRWVGVGFLMLPFFFLHVRNIMKTLRTHFGILFLLAMFRYGIF